MPRPSSGPRLWWDKNRERFTILDGRARHRTGFGAAEIGRAEKALRDYITGKHKPAEGPNPLLADVLATYAEEHIKHVVSGKHILYDIGHLNRWWGTKRVTDITATTCRNYVSTRNAGASARRELAFLRASIRFWQKERAPTMPVPRITMPPKPPPRQDFMTRSEAARFLLVARRTPHLARFFLIGWYTGSRRSVITGLKWSMVNLDAGVMHRKEHGQARTKKRSPPVKMGDRLLHHMRRWRRVDSKNEVFIVHFKGSKIDRPVSSWDRVRRVAGLPDYVVPHVLRHSRATTLMKAGISLWEASKQLGMSVAILESVYGHWHPDFGGNAPNAR